MDCDRNLDYFNFFNYPKCVFILQVLYFKTLVMHEGRDNCVKVKLMKETKLMNKLFYFVHVSMID